MRYPIAYCLEEALSIIYNSGTVTCINEEGKQANCSTKREALVIFDAVITLNEGK